MPKTPLPMVHPSLSRRTDREIQSQKVEPLRRTTCSLAAGVLPRENVSSFKGRECWVVFPGTAEPLIHTRSQCAPLLPIPALTKRQWSSSLSWESFLRHQGVTRAHSYITEASFSSCSLDPLCDTFHGQSPSR